MFNKNYYVPILKWKRAEQGALETLTDECKDRLSPVIELVMPKVKSQFKDKEQKIKKTDGEIFQELITQFRDKRINEVPDEIIQSWGKRMAFIDFSLLYTKELKVEAIKGILEKGSRLGTKLVPILNLSDDEEIKKEIKAVSKIYGNGICIRIVSNDLDHPDELNRKIEDTIAFLDTKKENIDLLVDIKEIDEVENRYLKYFNLAQEIKSLDEWRNFIFASSAFPEDLSECSVDEPKLLPRIEWTSWLEQRTKKTKRLPTFSDYTIRNPIYNESLQFFQSTSSIKYTLEDGWLILKGKKKQYEIYLASAAELIKDNRFYGENFCSGDKFIVEKGNHFENYIRDPMIKGTGNTEMWLKALINHHLSLTTHQLANLS